MVGFKDVGMGIVMKPLHQIASVLEDSTLVDGSLVGDLSLVNRGHLGQ